MKTIHHRGDLNSRRQNGFGSDRASAIAGPSGSARGGGCAGLIGGAKSPTVARGERCAAMIACWYMDHAAASSGESDEAR